MKKLKCLKILLLTFWSFFLLFNNYQSIKADDTSTNPDFENALITTPKGLNWDNDAFKIADFEKAYQHRKKECYAHWNINKDECPSAKKYSTFKCMKLQNNEIQCIRIGNNDYGICPILGNNSNSNIINPSKINNAKIIQSTNPKTPQTSVIQMTNAKYQTGAVWSNTSKDNYFDMNHEQTASMWIYFGKINGDLPADGMTFVLQNDSNGENAIALSADGIPVNGQSLGVWGADWDTKIGYNVNPETNRYDDNMDKVNIAKTSIQNSWALEFDTFANVETTQLSHEGNSFDTYISSLHLPDQHIAENYPSEESTYNPNYGYNSYFQLIHKNEKIFSSSSKQLVDSKWHHITIKWAPIVGTVTGNLTYSYDDKDPDTGIKKATNFKSTFLIDITKLGLSGTLGSKETDDKRLYWGFTGSTGIHSENNLLVFESIPSYVDVEANSSVYDYSQTPDGVQVTDTNNSVDSNSEIKYKFSLKYKGWTRTWDNIMTSLKIPDHVKFTSGTVTYPNSKTNQKPQPISPDVFQNIQNNNLQFQLPQSLNPDSRDADIELTGRVDQTGSTELTVPSVHADFEGNNLITGTDTQSFKIKPRHLTLSSDMPNPITLAPEQDAVITGQASYDGKNPNYQNMEIHQVLNSKDSIVSSKIDATGKFSFNIKSDQLEKLNNLDLYVTYKDNGTTFTSNHVYRQISIGGLLKIIAQDDISFHPVYGTFGERIIPRLDDWQIDVMDSRNKDSEWSVTAQVKEDMVDDKGNKLNGDIIYRDKTSSHDLKDPYVIATNKKEVDEPQTKSVTKDWTSATGILLRLNDQVKTGTYTAHIAWTLRDSI